MAPIPGGHAQPVASYSVSAPAKNSRTVVIGLLLGVLLLGAVAAFAIALPKASGDAGGAIELPDTLPGGYVATDLPEAFAGAPAGSEDQVDAAVRNEKAAREYGDQVLADSGATAATRTYLGEDMQTAVVVQAFRAAGGAFAPFQFTDPSRAEAGQEVERLVREGDAVCIQKGSATGSGEIEGGYVQCQRSEGDLTIQVTTPLPLEEAAEMVDTVWTQVS